MLKSIKFILFISLFLLLSLLSYRFFLAPKPISSPPTSPSPSPSISPSPSQTPNPYLNWQLYQNPKYNYQFKFDPHWTINDQLPKSPRYDRVIIQQNLQPLIEISLVNIQLIPITIEEFYDRLKTQFPSSNYIKTTNFSRQQIYAVLVSQPKSTSYYFLHQGFPLKIKIYGYSFSQLPPAYLYFLNHFSLL